MPIAVHHPWHMAIGIHPKKAQTYTAEQWEILTGVNITVPQKAQVNTQAVLAGYTYFVMQCLLSMIGAIAPFIS